MYWWSHCLGWSLSTSRRSLVFSRSRFLPRENDETHSHYNMVRGLVPSMVRCKGWAIMSWWEDWFLPCQIWVLSHSEVTVGCVPTWSYISVECHSLNGGTWLFTRNTHPRAEIHSNMVRGLVPSKVRCKGWAILSWWEDWFFPWLDVTAEPFWGDYEMCSHMIIYKH